MSFDQNTLESLRIERAAEQPKASSTGMYKWPIVAVLLTSVIGAYALLRDNAVEVETITAAATSSGAIPAAVLNASGYVVARRQSTVSSKVTGKITEVFIEEGTPVTEGQLLARLDDSTARPAQVLAQRQLEAARKKLEEVRVRLAEAQRALKRSEKMRASNLLSESQLDTEQSEVAAISARLEALKSDVAVAEGTLRVHNQEIDDLLVRAPFVGVVVSKDAQPGEMVSPMSAGGGFTRTGIATIVDMESREIEVDVNQAFINRVQAAQKTEAVLDAYADWTIPSHVINIVPTADRQKATVRVRIGFDQLDPRILPDMGVKVSFLDHDKKAEENQPAAARTSIRLPSSAVVRGGATSYVWRVEGRHAQRVAVSAGNERDGQIEILSGINGGDIIILKQVDGIEDGIAVKIKR